MDQNVMPAAGTPMPVGEQPPKKNSRNMIIIVVVIVIVCICCCVLGVAGWFGGDTIVNTLGISG
jgi:flagellar basal body-associated protein FliL